MDLEALVATSAGQYGVFSRRQALEVGCKPWTIEWALQSGRWTLELPGVYGVAGHRPSWRRRLWAAHLHAGPDSAVAFESAGRVHEFRQVRAGEVVLVVPNLRTHAPSGVQWHRLVDLSDEDVIEVPGLPPLTSPARTAVDLAGPIHIASLRLLVEQGLAERRFSLPEVGAVLGRVRRRGKPGVKKMAQVLDDLGPGDGIPRSELERLLDHVIELTGLPAPVHEHVLPNERGRTGFVDRCWPEAKLIVEGDGRKWHHRFQQALADNDRTLEAQALGWETSRLLWERLLHDAEGTARTLREVYRRRIELLGTRSV